MKGKDPQIAAPDSLSFRFNIEGTRLPGVRKSHMLDMVRTRTSISGRMTLEGLNAGSKVEARIVAYNSAELLLRFPERMEEFDPI
ncbi:MAG: hypothetical protein V1800_03530 [Candidatus Latescibacterota bacterium]